MSAWARRMVEMVSRNNEMMRLQIEEVLASGGSISWTNSVSNGAVDRVKYTTRKQPRSALTVKQPPSDAH